MAAFVLYYRVPDYAEMTFIRHYLKPGDLFVDVGANVGVYSLWASESNEVTVVAFEPSSTTCARAVENVALNNLLGRVEIIRKAVGASPDLVHFSTGRDAVNRVLTRSTADSEVVEQTTLDAELGSRRPIVIKVDVEGAEADVLRGGFTTISRYRPALIIEINDADAVEAFLEELGYTAWVYDPDVRCLRSATLEPHSNIIALGDADAAAARLAGSTESVVSRALRSGISC